MKKYTPAGYKTIRIAASAVKDYLVAYTVHDKLMDTTKRLKISVSTEDGPLVG